MCFSAQASFAAGIGLSIIGLLSLKKNRIKKLKPLAAIPLFFGIQQLCEGMVWITHAQPALATQNQLARYAFLFFAYVVWPVWMPFTIYMIETNRKKRLYLAGFIGAGTIISGTLLWALLKVGATSAITCNHVEYAFNMPRPLEPIGLVWYCITVIAPFFITAKKELRQLGVLIVISVLLSYIFYYAHLTSVWCFFAALLSAIIYKML